MIAKKQGFALFEIVLAIGCFALIALPIAGVVGNWMVHKESPKQRMETQQAAQELIQQLNRDFRAANEIHGPSAKALTLKVEGKYVRYEIAGTLKRLESPVLAGPFAVKAEYVVSGGEFIFSDAQGKTTLDVTKIASILLSGLKIQGSEYSVNVPALAVSQRFVVERASNAARYVLFSGNPIDDLRIAGVHVNVFGKTHSNADIDFADSNQFWANDVCEAVGSLLNPKNAEFQAKPGANNLAMPVFKPDTVFYRNVEGDIVLDDKGAETIEGSLYTKSGNITIDCKHLTLNGNVTAANGNITILGHDVTINGRVYAPYGKVTIDSQNHTTIRQVYGDRVFIDGPQVDFGPLE